MKIHSRLAWLSLLFCAGLLLGMRPALALDDLYEQVTPPQPLADPSKLEVVELFWYNCPHCYYFEPELRKWLEKRPADVAFVQVPAVFSNDNWRLFAQVYYTAEALGVLEKMHTAIFEAMHKEKKSFKDENAFMQLFEEKAGVKPENFQREFASFAVDMKVRNAKRLTMSYGLQAVPTVIVNGKYRLTSDQTNGSENLLKVVDQILEEARQEKAKAVKPATP